MIQLMIGLQNSSNYIQGELIYICALMTIWFVWWAWRVK